MKVVKIEKGTGSIEMDFFGLDVARFTYEDGEAAYIALNAFPNEATMIEDMTAEDGFVQLVVVSGKGRETGEKTAGDTVTNWTQVFPK